MSGAIRADVAQAVQLIGPRYHENLCFDAAEIIEREAGVFTPIDPRDARQ